MKKSAKVKDREKKTLMLPSSTLRREVESYCWVQNSIPLYKITYVLKLRKYGCLVDTHLVVAAVKGITGLEAGGHATLTISWGKSLLKRMNFTKRSVHQV